MKRCKKCALPETLINITFDDKGVCNFCLSYKKFEYKRETALNKMLNSYRGRGEKYDCLMLVSGGKDSISALYQLIDVYHMRVLAFNYDNGFVDQQAKLNLYQAVKILDIDLISTQNKSDVQKCYLRNNLLAWIRKPSPFTICMMCTGCSDGYIGGAYKLARQERIPLIMVGGCPVEPDLQWLLLSQQGKIEQVVRIPLELVKNPFFWNPFYWKNFVRSIHPRLRLTEHLKKQFGSISIVAFYSYVEWDEKEILSTIESKLGWKRSSDSSSTTRFDCKIHFLLDYLYKKKAGITDREISYSSMIRAGMITREEALARIKREEEEDDSRREKVISDLLKQLGLTLFNKLAILA